MKQHPYSPYTPNLLAVRYAYGVGMKERTFGSETRYGFDTQERVDELEEGHYTAEFWEYDGDLGLRWNTDPVTDPTQSPYACFNNNPIHYSDPNGDTPGDDKKPYKGGIQVFDAADAKGEVPGGQSKASESFKVGEYDVLPNYITNEKGEEQFSHYTASIMVKQIKPEGGLEDVARIDYVFGKNDLKTFQDNSKTLGGAANLMFGAGLHLKDWQIAQLNGGSSLGGYLKDQWTNPYNLLAGAQLMVAGMTPQPLEYAPRVRVRALEDPVSHNFPYSFDQYIIQSKPILESNGYKIYQFPGTMHGSVKNGVPQIKSGVFEIGMTKDGIIDHRFFRPN